MYVLWLCRQSYRRMKSPRDKVNHKRLPITEPKVTAVLLKGLLEEKAQPND